MKLHKAPPMSSVDKDILRFAQRVQDSIETAALTAERLVRWLRHNGKVAKVSIGRLASPPVFNLGIMLDGQTHYSNVALTVFNGRVKFRTKVNSHGETWVTLSVSKPHRMRVSIEDVEIMFLDACSANRGGARGAPATCTNCKRSVCNVCHWLRRALELFTELRSPSTELSCDMAAAKAVELDVALFYTGEYGANALRDLKAAIRAYDLMPEEGRAPFGKVPLDNPTTTWFNLANKCAREAYARRRKA